MVISSSSPITPLVLVVEDDSVTRALYREALTTAGFRVLEAHNGFQALEKAREQIPDAILTDIAVPGMDGFEFCRALDTLPSTRSIPILAVTGRGEYLDEPERFRDAGISLVLAKPCEIADIVSALRSLLVPDPLRRARL